MRQKRGNVKVETGGDSEKTEPGGIVGGNAAGRGYN
jgi:hypothetical protein